MTPRFLRDEAARFRGMAGDTDRAATRERFLAMAADYEARSRIADELEEPNHGEADRVTAESNLDDGKSEATEPTREEVPKVTLGRKAATGLKETVLVQRRPVGRPRRE